MNKFTNEVLTAAKQIECNASALTSAEGRKLMKNIRQKYSNGIKSVYFWESLKNRTSIQNKEAWSWVNKFINHRQAIMLFIDSEDDAGVVFQDGDCVVKTLWECTGFEFYLTDQKTDYLLCFNHHNFLIGTGTARQWIEETKFENYVESVS